MGVVNRVGSLLPTGIEDYLWWKREQLRFARRRRRHIREGVAPARPPMRVLVHPEFPYWEHTFSKTMAMAGVKLTRRVRGRWDVAVHFEDETEMTLDAALAGIVAQRPVVNGRCLDITKSRVNRVFGETFGYDIGVDPTTYDGIAVAKAEKNAQHDGREVQCPRPREPGVSYQRLVDTRTDDGEHVSVIRVPVIGGVVPTVYYKLRPVATHLTDADVSSVEHDPLDWFSQEEVDLIVAFAAGMNIDMGELDVLRDNADGRIYIVDANCNPWGPPDFIIDAGLENEAIGALVPAYLAMLETFRLPQR